MPKKTKLPPGPEDAGSQFQQYSFDPRLGKPKQKPNWAEGPPTIGGTLRLPSAKTLRRILAGQELDEQGELVQ